MLDAQISQLVSLQRDFSTVQTQSQGMLLNYIVKYLSYDDRYIHHVSDALANPNFSDVYMHLPSDGTPLSKIIISNPKFYPYFKDAVGAVDCTHIHTRPSDGARARYRDRNGALTQNIFAICNFLMIFIYVLSGWEGSASDSHIFHFARRRDLELPKGKYLLADAGFPSCDLLLVPYRGVRYHLKEWGRGNQK
jgi:hypothetical protein